MDFAIDQQQFLQGYLPIVILTNYAETKNLPTGNGEGLIMTGPGFVTQKDARTSSRSPRRVCAERIARAGTGRRIGEGPAPPPSPHRLEGTMASTTTAAPRAPSDRLRQLSLTQRVLAAPRPPH